MDDDKTTSVKPSYWYCDACQRQINHGETRYNCTVCRNYDYCQQCMTTDNPRHPHRMVPELAYGREEMKECMKIDMATGLRAAIAMYWDRHCMGIRDQDQSNPSIYKDSYSWFTFKTIGDRAKHFGHGLRQLINPRDYLGICAGNRPEWVITDFACIFQSIISVPIYTLFTDREIAYVINNTKISVIVCDKDMLTRFIAVQPQCSSLRHIVCMDPISDEVLISTSNNTDFLHYMRDVETNGAINTYEYRENGPDDYLTIIYTSGSSGFPKGAIISESAFRATFPRWCLPSSLERVTLSYRPLAWAADRDAIITTFLCGGRTGFSTGDPSRLMEELALVRPTYFGGPPSIWNKIYTEFRAALALVTANSPPEKLADEEKRLLQEFSKLIPNRCGSIAIGGAMVSPVVLDFMKRCFTHCLVHESYGITECGSVAFDNFPENTLQYRLESVPEMGYTPDDKPYSRGELLIKTPQMFSGYINNPDETNAAITDDGFFRTGDIVELRTTRTAQGDIHVIDRKKNFFKLAQGQFVSPEYLQSIYIQSPFIDQIYIHGDLLSDCVSAVIVPNQQYAQAYALQHHLTSFDTNNPHPLFSQAIQQDLRSIAEQEALRKHEIPSHIIIDFHPFTPENGLLTSSLKHCRHKIAAHYAHQLRANTSNNSLEQQLKTLIETVTGHEITSSDEQHHSILTTGTDSLSATRLSRMIEHDLGVSIPMDILFDPQVDLQQLTSLIQHPSHLSSWSRSIGTQLLKDANTDLDIIVTDHKNTALHPSMIFITGTTGFVGAFLLAELLTVHPSTCQFVCLVRCENEKDAFDRIRKNMLFYQIWNDEYEQRVIPLRGDLSKHHFGLANDETYDKLASEVDVIYHCGANVNFILPYHQLYGSNVHGTREIIRFATHHSHSCIPIQYVSTISVLGRGRVEKERSIDETNVDDLVGGYAQSKWVAEKLMSRASACGVRVVIYRLGLICSDSRSGACNVDDVYTMLLSEMMKMKCYPTRLEGGRVNGLPVDFTAKSIVYLSNGEKNTYGNIYHVINSDDEIKFEDIISGLKACSITVEGVSDDNWKKKLKKESIAGDLLKELLFESVFRENKRVSSDKFSENISSLECPSLNEDYVKKWVIFLLHKRCD
ncbi:hypothetical protein I4U23_023680 [Adineta vaga]|nr:hypothetical protein I4U23_023680 [Adineta vaga]